MCLHFPCQCGQVMIEFSEVCSPSSEDSESTWLDGATAVVPNDHDVAR